MSIGTPKTYEVDSNIEAFCNPDVRPASSSYPNTSGREEQHLIPGNILVFDGVALEGHCCDCPRRNMALCFCREHGEGISMKCDSIKAIQNLRDMIDKGELCFGSDATVVDIAPQEAAHLLTLSPFILENHL